MTSTIDLIVKADASAKLANAISEVVSANTNELEINTYVKFDNFPLVTDFGYFGNESEDVYAHSVQIITNVHLASEHRTAGVHHTYRINYRLVLRNGAIGSVPKRASTHRSTLENMFGETTVSALERDNVKQLLNEAKEMINMMEAYN